MQQVQPIYTATQKQAPRNPIWMLPFFLILILLPFPLAINWKRLGRPKWQLPTIAVPYIMMIMLVLAVLFRLELPVFLYETILALSVSIPTGFIAGVFFLQHGAYRYWRHTGNTANHIYNFKLAGILGLVVGVVYTGAIGGLRYYAYYNGPCVFNGEYLMVSYSRNWYSENLQNQPVCHQSYGECVLFLRYSPDLIIVFKESQSLDQTAEQVESATWWQILEYNPTWMTLSRHTIEVDGHQSWVREIQAPIPNYQEQYLMQVYVVDGPLVLEVSVMAANRDAFEDNRDKIMDVINTVEFR